MKAISTLTTDSRIEVLEKYNSQNYLIGLYSFLTYQVQAFVHILLE